MLTRRKFIGSTLGAGVALAAGAGCAVTQPAGKRMFVDAQVHFWKANTPDWPWVPGARPQLPEPFTIERALPLMDEAGVDRVIIVPPSWPGDRNDYAIEAVQRYPSRFAIMGRIPLEKPESAALLPKWREQPGMKGVRLTFHREHHRRWLFDGTADWFWAAAERAKLPVMIYVPGSVAKVEGIANAKGRVQLLLTDEVTKRLWHALMASFL